MGISDIYECFVYRCEADGTRHDGDLLNCFARRVGNDRSVREQSLRGAYGVYFLNNSCCCAFARVMAFSSGREKGTGVVGERREGRISREIRGVEGEIAKGWVSLV